MVGRFVKRDDGYYLDVDFGIQGQRPYPSRISDEMARTILTEAKENIESIVVTDEIPRQHKQTVLMKIQELLDGFDD